MFNELLGIVPSKDPGLIDQQPLGTLPSNDVSEQRFLQWYSNLAKKLGLNPNPYDQESKYNYRAAYDAGFEPSEKTGWHWSSKYKHWDHPNRIFQLDNGEWFDSKEDKIVTEKTVNKWAKEIGLEGTEGLKKFQENQKKKEKEWLKKLSKVLNFINNF